MDIISNWALKGTKNLSAVSKFSSTDILYLCDTICVDELTDILNKNGLPAFIVGDNAGFVDYSFEIFTVPFRGLELEWNQLKPGLVFRAAQTTDFCFNFLINKKQINRHLLIKLVEYFKFDLSTFCYTWSGVDRNFNLNQVIKEIDDDRLGWPTDFKNHILSPIELAARWASFQHNQISNVAIKNYGGNRWTWKNIFEDLILRSTVSLISESQQWQTSCVFTEKTLYAIMGLTFPIWIGGVGHAEYFKSMGFDTFDDVIDHSYQWQPTLIRRCYHAFADNLEILSNLSWARKVRNEHMHRLLSNRMLLERNQLRSHTDKIISQWPKVLQTEMIPFFNSMRAY